MTVLHEQDDEGTEPRETGLDAAENASETASEPGHETSGDETTGDETAGDERATDEDGSGTTGNGEPAGDGAEGGEPGAPASGDFDAPAVIKPADDNGDLVLDLDGYEGPIDVLLTLARDQKVDLKKISILELADQYLAFVAKARRLRLELAADYLVMAAWLAYLKSRLLLPEPPKDGEPSGAEMAAALAFQLQRLAAMQKAGAALLALPQLNRDFFRRGEPEPVRLIQVPVFNLTLYELLKAYGTHPGRKREGVLHIEPLRLFSMDDALHRIGDLIGLRLDWTVLRDFLPEEMQQSPLQRRAALAATFAASLELARSGRVQLRQDGTFGPIYLKAGTPRDWDAPDGSDGGVQHGNDQAVALGGGKQADTLLGGQEAHDRDHARHDDHNDLGNDAQDEDRALGGGDLAPDDLAEPDFAEPDLDSADLHAGDLGTDTDETSVDEHSTDEHGAADESADEHPVAETGQADLDPAQQIQSSDLRHDNAGDADTLSDDTRENDVRADETATDETATDEAVTGEAATGETPDAVSAADETSSDDAPGSDIAGDEVSHDDASHADTVDHAALAVHDHGAVPAATQEEILAGEILAGEIPAEAMLVEETAGQESISEETTFEETAAKAPWGEDAADDEISGEDALGDETPNDDTSSGNDHPATEQALAEPSAEERHAAEQPAEEQPGEEQPGKEHPGAETAPVSADTPAPAENGDGETDLAEDDDQDFNQGSQAR